MLEALYTMLISKIDTAVMTGLSGLVSYIRAPVLAGVTLYILLYGLAVVRGKVREPFMELAWRTVGLLVITNLVLNLSTYQQWVQGVFLESMPRALAGVLSGSSSPTGVMGGVQDLWNAGARVAKEMFSNLSIGFSSITGLGDAIGGIVVYVMTGICCAIAFVEILLARLALSLVILVGPIFIALAMFEPTRRWFWSWLNQAVTYVLLQVLIVAVGQLAIALTAQAVKVMSSNPVASLMGGNLLILVILIVSIAILYLRAHSLAAAIAGGGAGGGMVGMAAGLAMTATRGAAMATGRGAVAARPVVRLSP
jgi:type IV secretion system protein VirB6